MTYILTQQEYEHELKDLVQELALELYAYDPDYLDNVWLPQNVEGVPAISVMNWIIARAKKQQRR